MPPALLDRARAAGVPVSQTYGLTEACSQVTTTPLAAIDDGADGWAGTPLFCTRLRIAADGEIAVAGPTVAPGGLGEDGWLHTGDLGALDESGRLRVTGRASETIVSGGENVAPSEVEAVLESHPDVLEAAVDRPPRSRSGARPSPRSSWLARVPSWRRSRCARTARARLAPYKVPKQIVLAGEPLPRTRSGKLLRRELRDEHGSTPEGRPRSRLDAARALAEQWEEAAPGWVRRQEQIRAFGAPVAHWMVQAIDPSPGSACWSWRPASARPGMLAAELVAPVGGVIVSDQAEAMLEGARARAPSWV